MLTLRVIHSYTTTASMPWGSVWIFQARPTATKAVWNMADALVGRLVPAFLSLKVRLLYG
jgi:hypothetical protein